MYFFCCCATIVIEEYTMPFNKLLSIGLYDFVTVDKFGKMVGPFLAPHLRL